jgi:hypothetical protein
MAIEGRMINVITGAWDDRTWFGAVTVDRRTLRPERSRRLRNHSPTGFAWGYEGSGPAQLALAILLEAGATDEQALAHYQDFKREQIAAIQRSAFTLEIDILAWLASR